MNKTTTLNIQELKEKDISLLTKWACEENFSPGIGDLSIYRNTDRQGIWIGFVDNIPIGCICGIKYNQSYGFIGMFIVIKEFRGKGYGLCLWKHALSYLQDLSCIGLEAAPNRIKDYEKWGFKYSSETTRWILKSRDTINNIRTEFNDSSIRLLTGDSIPEYIVQNYDANKEQTPRPHFLSDWLHHPAGTVLALIDDNSQCLGFGRIRPCLMTDRKGWRIGPLIANSTEIAQYLLSLLVNKHQGHVLIDSPGLNLLAKPLLVKLGFKEYSNTFRMYKGYQPKIELVDVYGLASLELG